MRKAERTEVWGEYLSWLEGLKGCCICFPTDSNWVCQLHVVFGKRRSASRRFHYSKAANKTRYHDRRLVSHRLVRLKGLRSVGTTRSRKYHDCRAGLTRNCRQLCPCHSSLTVSSASWDWNLRNCIPPAQGRNSAFCLRGSYRDLVPSGNRDGRHRDMVSESSNTKGYRIGFRSQQVVIEVHADILL